MTYLQIGNLSIPSLWLALLITLFGASLFHKVLTGKKIGEWYWNGLFLYFLTWKFSYILFNTSMVIDNPLSIIYFSGGIKGHLLAITFLAVYFVLVARKKHPDIYKETIRILPFAIFMLSAVLIILSLWKPASTDNVTTMDEMHPSKKILSAEEGKPAPDFTLTTLEGETVKLSDYKGKKVILNFWATWCPPCKAEMPHMQNFYEKNKTNNIVIVAVNLTNLEKGETKVKNFVTEYGLTFDILLDQEGTVGDQYHAISIPTSYFIDSKGMITKKIIGPMDGEMMGNLTKGIN